MSLAFLGSTIDGWGKWLPVQTVTLSDSAWLGAWGLMLLVVAASLKKRTPTSHPAPASAVKESQGFVVFGDAQAVLSKADVAIR